MDTVVRGSRIEPTDPGTQPAASQSLAAAKAVQARRAGTHDHIKGWGVDLDRANRPAVPMERTPPRLDHVHWEQPEQQPLTVPVLHSIERPGVTPLFGTSSPPKGLSGAMRRFAFGYSENDLRHWLVLLAADRVNMVEGLFSDLARGHVPNVLGEMGIKAELKHNPAGLVRKAVVAGAVVGLGYALLTRRRRR